MSCADIGIPKHLHQNDKKPDQDFRKDSFIYIRVEPGKLKKQLPDMNTFTTRDQSCNRDKYSQSPEDVLYDINAKDKKDHYFNRGIVALKVSELEKQKFTHPEINYRIYTLRLFHKPEECMYPHSEIHTHCNNEYKKVKPEELKLSIKNYYRKHCKILRRGIHL